MSFHSSNSGRNLNAFAGPSSSTSFPTPPSTDVDLMNTQKTIRDIQQYLETYEYPFIKDISCYEKLNKIGQGTFGEVFKAMCKRTKKMVALKKILMENEKEGFPITALREVKMLQQLKHPNITDLIEVCTSKSNTSKDKTLFYLVFAFCEHDLAGLLSNRNLKIQPVHIKTMMQHLLSGLCKLHRSKILHRDMKSANVLLSKEGVLKLADFGLARPFLQPLKDQPAPLYTNRVVTLWYRPPELLLGDRQYNTKIDVWGAGCIMAEMWVRTPIMQGESEQKQLILISTLCGSINKEVWPKCETMPLWRNMATETNSCLPQGKPRILKNKLPMIKDDDGFNLLDLLLSIDPDKRPTAEDAIDNKWFYMKPECKENVYDLIENLKTSQFEFTVGRGVHANRNRQQQQNNRPQPMPRPANLPAGQLRDIVW
ncbi:unnamed protein product [Caenorhabditis angaria]|uniref:Protein kinase domain-containing protein n=1 Tax=Caenorhabditis angaria TaxID=860376 RepID=A0A9P1MUS2_9PELO|nr:unnamed protein product [Caenorhabditis angaria]